MKKVAIVGTMGLPANYGGFETLVENLVTHCTGTNIEYTVFCSSLACQDKLTRYKNAKLKYLGLKANGTQSILYDVFSLIECLYYQFDTILILGVSGCLFLPIFRLFYRRRLIINIDGLEHKRAKWNWIARQILVNSEKMALRYGDIIIADNKGIQDYIDKTYKKSSKLIAYGGDHAMVGHSLEHDNEILSRYGLLQKSFALSICRIEPENNCHLIFDAFAHCNDPLVFVGNFDHSEYSRNIRRTYQQYDNIIILDAIYDLEVLYTLRSNCKWYIHGHSAGGTNPSLVEAMHFGRPILAFDVIFNRETTQNKASYWKNSEELLRLINSTNDSGHILQSIAREEYVWKKIVRQYEELY